MEETAMERERRVASLILILMMVVAMPAMSQISVTALQGVVRDQTGAVIPGVELKLQDTSTGIEKTTLSIENGAYLFTNLVDGNYKLTAVFPGFRTAIYDSVVINTGRTADLPVELRLGEANSAVEVIASAVQLETTANTVSSTIKNASIMTLPNSGRSVLDFSLLVPGAMTADTTRNSTFNGLPNASMNITLDGMNNNSQRFKSGGTSFFAFAPMRIDAVEEISVATSGLGAESAGQGAMTIQVVTKRGTDKYHVHLLEQWHNEWLNAIPYTTKLASSYDPTQVKPRTRQNYIVGSVGGPLLPWVAPVKNKLFFFAYFEAVPQPFSNNRSVFVLKDEALTGNYTFIDRSGVRRSLNALDIARQNGFPSAIDPTVKGMLDQIHATQSTPGVNLQEDANFPYRQSLNWVHHAATNEFYPTARVDLQATPQLAWHGSWNFRNSRFAPTNGAPYPGQAASKYEWADGSKANVYTASTTLDWTVSKSLFNNFVFGIQRNGEFFSPGFDIHQYSNYGDRRLVLPLVTTYIPDNTTDVRNNPVMEVKDNLTWIKGKHTVKMGASLLHTTFWSRFYGNRAGVLSYNFGVRADDPINNVLDTAIRNANVNTANTTDIDNFKALYSLLTGRISGITGTANVNPATKQFEKFFPQPTYFAFNTAGLFFQDLFRATRNLTLNYGLRWQFDGTMHGTVPIYSNVAPDGILGPSKANFQPGILGGNMNPAFIQDSSPYKSDFFNPGPNFGFAWNPSIDEGILGSILGREKTVLRGSFGITFYNEGLNTISNYLPSNPGATQTIAGTANVNFKPGELLLSNPEPPLSVSPATFTFPIPLASFVLNGGRSINAFNPNMKSPYTSNWMLGIQRELTRGVTLDVRYVANKSTHMWHQQNINEINVVENGFISEFINAQKNLAISRTATGGSAGETFQNRNLPGQVPLPIFEAAFGANGTQAAMTVASGFGNATYIRNLDFGEAGALATTLGSTATPALYCRLVGSNFAPCADLGYTAAKYPMNFFKANPFANNVNYLDSNADNNYNSLQIELKKQMSRGLSASVNYTWGHAIGDQGNITGQGAEDTWLTMRNAHLSYRDTPFDRRHNFSALWEYQLPMGPGHWLNPSGRILSQAIRGWTIAGIDKIGTGVPAVLSGGRSTFNNLGPNNLGADGGVVFGNGMTATDLIRRLDTIVGNYDYSCRCFHTDVKNIQLANGAVDPGYYKPGDTPGVIGGIVRYRGKPVFNLDMSVGKEISVGERAKMGIKANISNFLNHPFRTGYGNTTITNTTFGQLTGFTGTRTINLRAYLDF
jgi:hypothetical protein